MSFSGDLYPTAGADAVMTTTGDLVRYNAGARQRLGIGSTNQALSVVGGLPAWKTLTLADSVLTTGGDVLYENNTPELARLPKGSDGDVLTLASGLPSWAAASGGNASTDLVKLASGWSSSSTSTVDITGFACTIPNISGGKAIVTFSFTQTMGTSGNAAVYSISDGTTAQLAALTYENYNTGHEYAGGVTTILDANGQTAKLTFSVSGGTNCSIPRNTTSKQPLCYAFAL